MKTGFFDRFFSILMIYRSLCLFRAILAQELSSFFVKRKFWFFDTPGTPEGASIYIWIKIVSEPAVCIISQDYCITWPPRIEVVDKVLVLGPSMMKELKSNRSCKKMKINLVALISFFVLFFIKNTWQMSDEHLQTFALHAPLSAPDDSKYVQFSLACPPQLIVTANNGQKKYVTKKCQNRLYLKISIMIIFYPFWLR